jgi:hypothetical protein
LLIIVQVMSTPTSLLAGRNELLEPRSQKYRRLKFLADVEVAADLALEGGRSHDLSASGMFVDAAQEYVIGMPVRLRFRIQRRDFDTRARIVHVKPQIGFGAIFLDLTQDERNHILRFVHGERARREAERLLRARD